ncbi:hypothetical protein HYDPIDRAFT_33327 [Hydnomerulius pinastri MD-312]|uniref:Unplaced genomic scaffold scaffold_58, whole genome shotgun sequence n=1 Tax=Hydnomerulius pinastri MD-312 TaxID=994086 RepID=A0A0C9W904_9AGAM|nr:hypothetical protein HYDPIDRAFT_33327 [Hydnomerulius pinastri MD-312]
MDGEEIVHNTTRSKIKAAMDDGCGLCRLLWLACQTRSVADGDEPPADEIQFRLTVRSERLTAGFRSISPEGVQYLSVDPVGGYGKRYYIYTSPDDPSTAEIIARTPVLDVSSSRAFQLAQECLVNCITDHANCPKPGVHTPLPTRVIDCGDPSRPQLFVSQGAPSPYVALSYVWGGPQTYCTKSTNLDTYISNGIDTRFIPQTIQDAIKVTTKLGLRYLWVDALCIIQDSDEDKANELQQMRRIYRDAHLTIIASSAASASTGFLQTRTLAQEYAKHPQLPFHCRDGRVGSVFAFSPDGPASVYKPMKEPVNTRAWCLQERLLSLRKLVYATDTIQYHCQTALADVGNAVSGKPVGEQLNDIMFKFSTADDDPNEIAAHLSKWTPAEWQGMHEEWRMIVSSYTRRGLSNQEDKLLAFAGVAEEFHRIWGAHAGRYLAGVWEKLLPNDLLWTRMSSSDVDSDASPSDSRDPLRPQLSRSFAPSWSWASVDGHVLPDDSEWSDHDNTACQVLHCDLTLEDNRLPYGHVVSASLRLRAVMVPTPWIVFPKVGGNPERYLSLYMPTDLLRSRLAEVDSIDPEQREGIVVGEMSEENAEGEKVSTHKVTLHKDHLPRGGLLALESGMEEDSSLLTFMGDVTVMFDSSERVPSDQVAALLINRFEVGGEPGAKGLLVADTGDGKFRRIGYWISFIQLRGSDRDDADGRKRTVWFDPDDLGSTARIVELV